MDLAQRDDDAGEQTSLARHRDTPGSEAWLQTPLRTGSVPRGNQQAGV